MKIKDDRIGKEKHCPKCKNAFIVPAEDTVPPATAKDAPAPKAPQPPESAATKGDDAEFDPFVRRAWVDSLRRATPEGRAMLEMLAERDFNPDVRAAAYQELPANTPLRVPNTEGRDPSQPGTVLVTSPIAGTPFSVVAETAPFLTRLQVGVNLALGPVEPVLRKALYGELVYDRRDRAEATGRFLARRKERGSRDGSPYGTAYLWTAGLLNLLLLLDVWDLATGRKR